MKRYIFAILFCWSAIALATISLEIDPPTVQLDKPFRLTFSIDDAQVGSAPDFTPLQKDFTIIGTERSIAYSFINGQAHSINQWRVLLTAKTSGVLLIPAIMFGHQESTANSIQVTEYKPSAPSDDQVSTLLDEVMLTTDISQHQPYVNQQLIYTVKLYNNQRLMEAEYQPPRVEDALLIPLGDGLRYQTTLNGHEYAVEEQRYAIFPQKSGSLKVIGPSFNALVFDAVPRRVKVHAKTTKLIVKPIPADYTGKYWLPAKQVALTETYDQSNMTLNQGSTLVRTLTLQVAGIPAQLFPTLEFVNSPEFNVYPDKPNLQNKANQHELIGRADMKVTYLLNKAGQITIPAIHVPWFNTLTGKEEIVSLPARTLDIKAKAGVPQQTTAIHPDQKEPPVLLPTPESPAVPAEKTTSLAGWIASGFALTGIMALAWWRFRKPRVIKGHEKRLFLKELHAACKKSNPKEAQIALLRWAAVQWPGVELLNVHQLAKLIHDTALKKQLFLLSQVIYSQERTQPWQGDPLWQSITAYLRTKPTTKSKSRELPPINP